VASISWSPDGKKLVLAIQRGEKTLIEIFDIASSSLQPLGEGNSPTWSPSGDSIAYLDASNQKIHLVHTDGTDDRVLKDVGGRVFGYRYFGLGPVWSPDSTKLLINKYKGDGDYLDVVLLDVKSGRMTTKSHNGYPVLGWARSTK
jgi:Tol biopolymer transport system component